MPRLITSLILLLTVLLLHRPVSPAGDSPKTTGKEGLFIGETRILGNGVIWSWVKLDVKGNPASIGVTFTDTSLSGLPEDPPSNELVGWEYTLALPKHGAVAPFTHIAMDWNPRGHIPPGVYDVPHFDFHFFLITRGQRDKITAKGPDLARCYRKPESKFIPAGYILPKGTEYPGQGAHWIDPSAPEFNQTPFTRTFIYGSYDGKVVFIEPMMTKAFLESKPDVTESIKLPAAFQRHGYYPASYAVRYDAQRREYTVSLEGLKRK